MTHRACDVAGWIARSSAVWVAAQSAAFNMTLLAQMKRPSAPLSAAWMAARRGSATMRVFWDTGANSGLGFVVFCIRWH